MECSNLIKKLQSKCKSMKQFFLFPVESAYETTQDVERNSGGTYINYMLHKCCT